MKKRTKNYLRKKLVRDIDVLFGRRERLEGFKIIEKYGLITPINYHTKAKARYKRNPIWSYYFHPRYRSNLTIKSKNRSLKSFNNKK